MWCEDEVLETWAGGRGQGGRGGGGRPLISCHLAISSLAFNGTACCRNLVLIWTEFCDQFGIYSGCVLFKFDVCVCVQTACCAYNFGRSDCKWYKIRVEFCFFACKIHVYSIESTPSACARLLISD